MDPGRLVGGVAVVGCGGSVLFRFGLGGGVLGFGGWRLGGLPQVVEGLRSDGGGALVVAGIDGWPFTAFVF